MRFFRNIWATAGDKAAIPDETQGDGSLSYQQGFTSDYELDQNTDPNAKDIPRPETNQVFGDITENIRDWQTGTYPRYAEPSENGATNVFYPFGSLIKRESFGVTEFFEVVNIAGTSDLPPSDNWLKVQSTNNVQFTGCAETASLSLGNINAAQIAAVSQRRFAFLDDIIGELRMYEFIDGVFTQIGSSFPIIIPPSTLAVSAMGSVNGSNRVSIQKRGPIVPGQISNSIEVYDFDGSNWSAVGNTLDILTNTFSVSLYPFSLDKVIVRRIEFDDYQVYQFDGTNFNALGSPTVIPSGTSVQIKPLNKTDVVISDNDSGDNRYRVFRFDGSDFNQIGSTTNLLAGFSSGGFVPLSDADIAVPFSTGTNSFMRVFRFNGNSFSQVSNQCDLGVVGSATPRSITALTGDQVIAVFEDVSLNGQFKSYQFGSYVGKGPSVLNK